MKLVLIPIILSFSLSAMAQDFPGMATVKERLRLSLWYEGVEAQTEQAPKRIQRSQAREELIRPLRKLFW
jgi:hypothetical protein